MADEEDQMDQEEVNAPVRSWQSSKQHRQGEEEEEEDLVDPQDELKEQCGELSKCAKLKEVLDECNDRVSGRTKTAEICAEELVRFVHCVDHCVSTERMYAATSVSPIGCKELVSKIEVINRNMVIS